MSVCNNQHSKLVRTPKFVTRNGHSHEFNYEGHNERILSHSVHANDTNEVFKLSFNSFLAAANYWATHRKLWLCQTNNNAQFIFHFICNGRSVANSKNQWNENRFAKCIENLHRIHWKWTKHWKCRHFVAKLRNCKSLTFYFQNTIVNSKTDWIYSRWSFDVLNTLTNAFKAKERPKNNRDKKIQ